MLFAGQTLGRGLVEAPALRGKENDARGRLAEFLQREGDRFDLEHHAGPAAVGRFVGHPVLAWRPIAEIAQADIGRPFFPGDAQHAFVEQTFAHGRKKCEDVDLHGFLAIMPPVRQPDKE